VRKVLFSLLLSLLVPLKAGAQTEDYSYYLIEKELQVITATKEKTSLVQVPRYTVVITREEIDRLGAKNLFDLLDKLPQFYVWRSFFGLKAVGALGVKQSYYSEKVQVLIDGMPILDPSNGSSFSTNDNVSLENVKQVEIVYGPLTSLYGFNSVLAVINLVTYSPSQLRLNAESSISTGDDRDFSFTRAFKKGSLKGLVTFNYREDRSPHRPYVDFLGVRGNYSKLRKDGSFYLKLKSETGLYFRLYVVDRDDHFPVSISQLLTTGNSFADRKAFISKLGYRWWGGSWRYDLSFGYNWFYLKRGYNLCPFNHDFCSSTFKQELLAVEKRYAKEPHVSFSVNRGNWLLGVDYKEARLYKTEVDANFVPSTLNCSFTGLVYRNYGELPSSETLLPEVFRSTFSPYLQYFKKGENYSALFNLRWDKTNDAGDTLSSSLSLMKKLSEGASLKLNLGKAARVPSFEEMYIRNNPILLGNPHLKIEKEYSVMPSLEVVKDRLSFSLFYYKTWFDDFIYKKKVGPVFFQWANSDSTVRIQGVSTRLKYRLFYDWELQLSLHHRFSVHGLDSEYLIYPKNKAVAALNYRTYLSNYNLSAVAYSKVDGAAPGFVRWDFNYYRRLSRRLLFNLFVKNLFNRKYYYPNGSPGEERTLWLGLRYSF